VFKVYEQKTGRKVDQVYGHMGQVLMQAKTAGTIGIIAGEQAFLKGSDLAFADFKPIGAGLLVLAYGKQAALKTADDLVKPEIKKVAMPDAKQAIYGKAAKEFLQHSGLAEKIRDKLLTVATVPQVSAYLISQDAEAGFINITDAIYIKDKIGGFIQVDKAGYTPIHLVFGVLKGFEDKPEVTTFLSFVAADPDVQQILKNAGIGQ